MSISVFDQTIGAMSRALLNTDAIIGKGEEYAKDRKRREALERHRLHASNQRVLRAETRLAALQRIKTEVEQELADATLYEAGNSARLCRCLDRQAENERALAREESDWLEAHEDLEQLRRDSTGAG